MSKILNYIVENHGEICEGDLPELALNHPSCPVCVKWTSAPRSIHSACDVQFILDCEAKQGNFPREIFLSAQLWDMLRELQNLREQSNAIEKACKDKLAQIRAKIPALENPDVALMFNCQIIATQQTTVRRSVSTEMLKTQFPDIAEKVTIEKPVTTLKVTI